MRTHRRQQQALQPGVPVYQRPQRCRSQGDPGQESDRERSGLSFQRSRRRDPESFAESHLSNAVPRRENVGIFRGSPPWQPPSRFESPTPVSSLAFSASNSQTQIISQGGASRCILACEFWFERIGSSAVRFPISKNKCKSFQMPVRRIASTIGNENNPLRALFKLPSCAPCISLENI